MIKYTTLHIKGNTFVAEIECEKIFAADWELLPGESKYRILSPPEYANEIWYSHSVYDTEGEAKTFAIKQLRSTMERTAQKKGIPFVEQDFFKKVTLINTRKLK
jgi:hypothetical protein